MNNLNTVLIEGTLTRDPERKSMTAESSYCRLSVANNRYYADRKGNWQQETSFFSIYVFGNVSETCMKYLKKGRGIRVVGRLKQYRFQNEGLPREYVYIIAEHIEFQPEKKVKEIPEPEIKRVPGELNTTANLDGLVPPPEAEPLAINEGSLEKESVTINIGIEPEEVEGKEF